MVKNLLVFSDGTEVFSGDGKNSAIGNLSYVQSVNSAQDLTLGAVCAGMLQAELITPGGDLLPQAGEQIAWYRVDETGQSSLQGYFLLEKPERVSANRLQLTGYDRVVKLDKDLSIWLQQLQAWPYALDEFARLTAEQCGVELTGETLPNGDFSVEKFTGQGITGRMLFNWIGQIAGRFCRATREGKLEFAWYEPTAVGIDPAGTSGCYYYENTLKYQDYTTAPIAKVQIRKSANDIGTVYPDVGGNTYILEDNPLLQSASRDAVLEVAQSLYQQLRDVSYTPATVAVPADAPIQAGQILSVIDRNGRQFSCYVMKRTLSGGRSVLECTGNRCRDDTTAVNHASFRNLSGKMLNLSMDVDGIRMENRDVQDNLAAIRLELSGISSQVSRNREEMGGVKTQVSQLEQNADSLQITLQQIRLQGVSRVTTSTGYTFDEAGLHIRKSGQQMENTLDNTGMTVARSGTPILQATAAGVVAADVQVNNYLIIGNCRFEDYSNGADSRRTACFYTG